MAGLPISHPLWQQLRTPGFAPSQRAQALAGFQNAGLGGGGGIDLSSAFQTGISASDGGEGMEQVADAGGGYPQMQGDSTGISDIDPKLVEMTRRMMMEDSAPTAEDKGLALAQAGFAMAAGDSPHALQNIGAGALYGAQSLQKMRQDRALQRMKEAQAYQQLSMHQQALEERKRAAMEAAETRREAIQQREDAARQASLDRQAAIDARAEAQAAAQAARDQAAQALAETRYNNADLRRREMFAKTGQWAKIEGDEERGVTSAPEGEGVFTGPVVDDPGIGYRERQKLLVAKPKQEQALTSIDLSLGRVEQTANDLLKHEGMGNAVGMRVPGMSLVPGTDAADFVAKLDSLKSQVFAQAIQAMRDASKTGGAVGNVSDKEGARFESMLAPLAQAQSEKQFKEALNTIIDYTKELKTTYKDSYRQTYGSSEEPGKPETETPPPPAPDATAAPNVIIQNGSKFDRTTHKYLGPA